MRLIAPVFAALTMALSAPIGLLGQSPQLPASVSIPRVVSVTGVYQPADGQPPPAGTVVTLLIYADEQGGTPLWQETQNVGLDKSGRYSLLLGAAQADGIPLEVFASGDARWLALHFAGLGETEGSRTRITSVPYALKSADADTLGGHPASAYVLAPTSTATDGHSAKATSTAKDTAQSNASTDAVLTGTTNVIAKYVNSADVGNSAIFESNGLVGINTTAPADVLHLRFSNTIGSMTGLAVQNMGNTATSYSGTLFYDQNGALGQFQGFNNSTHEYRINNIASAGSINFMLGSASKFRILSTGDISIAGNLDFGSSGRVTKSGHLLLHTEDPFMFSTFLGTDAGNFTFTGQRQTGIGASALSSVTTGQLNTGVGYFALRVNTTGTSNSAFGDSALPNSTTGFGNTGIGTAALLKNVDGSNNAAMGYQGLVNNTSGANNTALGSDAGFNATTGSNNIYLGANVMGVAGESNTMYLGLQGTQTKTLVAGVRGITTGAADAVSVVIDSTGQLGTINSSRRYKEDIQDMGDASRGLMQLRPVTYRYKQAYADGSKPIDYGLIAEEVEQVYPDLVAHLADGEVETVQYQKINAMLLNEVQKQHAEIAALKARLDALERERR